MRIKVLSDSTCDLPQTLIEEYGITMVPLTVVMGDADFKDGVDIHPDAIFSHVASGGALCSTSAVSVGEYQSFFERYAHDYEGIVHINIGSGFSASHQNALLAAEDFDNVLVVDSQSLTVGQGLVVLEACRLAREGKNLAEIKIGLDALIPRLEVSFVLERLDYMVKGGRCSAAAALGANLLNLKPCIELRDGKLTVAKKYRGTYTRCLSAYVKDRLAGREDVDKSSVSIVYTQLDGDSLAEVKNTVASFGVPSYLESVAGCTVSCHCGPGTCGVIFLRK